LCPGGEAWGEKKKSLPFFGGSPQGVNREVGPFGAGIGRPKREGGGGGGLGGGGGQPDVKGGWPGLEKREKKLCFAEI